MGCLDPSLVLMCRTQGPVDADPLAFGRRLPCIRPYVHVPLHRRTVPRIRGLPQGSPDTLSGPGQRRRDMDSGEGNL